MLTNKKQRQEWAESPVAEELRGLIQKHLDGLRLNKGIEVYHPFDPARTQELLAQLNGAIDSWEEILEVLEGDWTLLELEEDGEQFGDLPSSE